MNLQVCLYIIVLIYVREGDTGGACHYFSENKLDWFDALFACQKKKLCLANFDTKEAFDDLPRKLNITEEYWIGLNGYEKNVLRYVSNNEGVKYMPPEATINVEQPCIFLKPIFQGKLTFESDYCLRRRRYVCSSAVICNGVATNSTYKDKYSTDLPCDMSDIAKDVIGIPK
ncbi:uncharacterized protein LOC133840541 [Drosophila sulfurigaster albostrigata]|uniref:uncharacterized protein LOC133840541 n=1 Tax=Drosophila sulfurigaster albostrigata TaxID=89887 RepID=UPI002D21E291|nr:uncharacterized protein LOC133840541 [Drosophila sulfurigaster albostrigata]